MLRVHFTTDDLLGTRFAPSPAPLIELGLALATLQGSGTDVVFDGWRQRLRPNLTPAVRSLLELVPPRGDSPTFLDPVSTALDDGLELVRSAPTDLVRRELSRVCAQGRPVTPWIRELARHDRTAWRTLTSALTTGYDTVLAADWPRVRAGHRADLAYRAHLVTQGGLRAGIASIYPGAYWDGAALTIPGRSTADKYLDGRGVTLLPSVYATSEPLFGHHSDGSALFVYPALTPLPLISLDPGDDALADLLGRTRAAALRALTQPRSTTELAGELGVSLAAASAHAKTLRANGLVDTQRAGKAVVHRCAPLGLRLLVADQAPDRPAGGARSPATAS
jgi:DNA-binding transcriptional ArsR family regulator